MRKNRVNLDRGAKSRYKQVIVEDLDLESVIAKLKSACDARS